MSGALCLRRFLSWRNEQRINASGLRVIDSLRISTLHGLQTFLVEL